MQFLHLEVEEKPNTNSLMTPGKINSKNTHRHVHKSQSKLPPTHSFKKRVTLTRLLLSQSMVPSTVVPLQLNQTKKFQSDTTFILQDTAESLNIKKEPVKLKVSTISITKFVSCQKVNSLQVRAINSGNIIKLPTTYTRDYIPANRSHIPTSKTVKFWPLNV